MLATSTMERGERWIFDHSSGVLDGDAIRVCQQRSCDAKAWITREGVDQRITEVRRQLDIRIEDDGNTRFSPLQANVGPPGKAQVRLVLNGLGPRIGIQLKHRAIGRRVIDNVHRTRTQTYS